MKDAALLWLCRRVLRATNRLVMLIMRGVSDKALKEVRDS
jgi:hypothetical protein